jgi:hypothetical protein
MMKHIVIAALVATSLTPVAYIGPAAAQQSSIVAPQICQTYTSNGVYGFAWKYASHNNVDLAATFSTIDSISGSVVLTTSVTKPAITVPIFNPPPAGLWAPAGYGWRSIHTNATGATGAMLMDIRFGPSGGIFPGQTSIPTGTLPLYVVGRTGISDTKSFTLTICGQPKSTQICANLKVSQAPGATGRFMPTAQIPMSFPATAKIVSLESTNMTVAAYAGTPAETKSIITPFALGQPKTAKFPIALGNRDVRFFAVNANHETAFPVDTWRAQAGQGQHYLTIGETVVPGQYVSPVNSWQGAVGAPDSVPRGNISGDVRICVQ